jgi:hypothetical protein
MFHVSDKLATVQEQEHSNIIILNQAFKSCKISKQGYPLSHDIT